MKKFLLFTIVIIFTLSLTTFATNKLSPAIDVIANDYSMVKASVVEAGDRKSVV